MALYVPRKIPINWYKFEMKYSIELLEAFINSAETQIKVSVQNFIQKKEILINREKELNASDKQVFIEHEGLNNKSFNLDGVFLRYFPNLQRRSAFITLYGFLEHELEVLCALFISTEHYKIELNDFKDLGIERSIKYLEKVAQLPIDKSDNKWNTLKVIQKMRNVIVHNDGNLNDLSGKPKYAELKKYIQLNKFLTGDDEILLEEGFLGFVLESFDIFFRYLDELIQARNRLVKEQSKQPKQ